MWIDFTIAVLATLIMMAVASDVSSLSLKCPRQVLMTKAHRSSFVEL